LPLCLVALEGEVELVRRKGRRVVAATDFFTGLLSTAREADEVVAGVRYPTARPDRGYAFSEIAERHGDFALASFAAIAGEGFVRLAVGAAADRPVARTWSTTDLDELADALNDFAWDLGGIDDPHASARYRRDLVRTQGKATIAAALHRAGLLGSREPLRGAAT
jgi:2-furoyl-CoA dehydrogenase FAD binding subunit